MPYILRRNDPVDHCTVVLALLCASLSPAIPVLLLLLLFPPYFFFFLAPSHPPLFFSSHLRFPSEVVILFILLAE